LRLRPRPERLRTKRTRNRDTRRRDCDGSNPDSPRQLQTARHFRDGAVTGRVHKAIGEPNRRATRETRALREDRTRQSQKTIARDAAKRDGARPARRKSRAGQRETRTPTTTAKRRRERQREPDSQPTGHRSQKNAGRSARQIRPGLFVPMRIANEPIPRRHPFFDSTVTSLQVKFLA
jgi:hypothetical protein